METEGESTVDESVTTYIGLATVTGFIVMLLIEEIFKILEESKTDKKEQFNDNFRQLEEGVPNNRNHLDSTEEQTQPLIEREGEPI